MRNKGKRGVDSYDSINYNNEGDYFDTSPQILCTKHPNSSSYTGGICAYCLNDKLAELVCPKCGEQRFPSCSCNEGLTTEEVARISFLLENDQQGSGFSSSNPRAEPRLSNYDEYSNSNLQRCNSISAPRPSSSDQSSKFWKFGKLFRKKKDKSSKNQQYQTSIEENSTNNNNNEFNKFTRSRSVCNYRDVYDTEESGNFPAAASNLSAARASCVSNFAWDSAKMSCFSETEARFSNFEARSSNFDCYDASNFMPPSRNNMYSVRENEFVTSDAYIDLKLNDISLSSDYNSSRGPPDLAAMKRSGFGLSTREFGSRGRGGGGGIYGHDMYNNGGRSCRMSSVSDRDLRKCKKGSKVWKWFSKHNNSSSGKYDDHNAFDS